MIAYLDASALVKRYVAETGSDLVAGLLRGAEVLATAAITHVEVTAALAKAVRVGALEEGEALAARQLAARDWPHLARLPLSEAMVQRAAALAWSDRLRGYDAVHLAAACAWRESLDLPVTFATFDARLWEAAGRQGLTAFPHDLPALLDDRRSR